MKVYYDKDAALDNIKNLSVTIIGYGSQGHAHALNLKESGENVTVGLRQGSSNFERAQKEGLNVLPIKESVTEADIVMILAPDEYQASLCVNYSFRAFRVCNSELSLDIAELKTTTIFLLCIL